jgi:AcrR family transcriptional regulator
MPPRERLSRDRVLAAAVALADAEGLDGLSMRRLAEQLGVVPMALYKHVADKEELLDGMVDAALAELALASAHLGWRKSVRTHVLAARAIHLRHRWLRRVMESRTNRTLVVLAHTDRVIAVFREAGFSDQLTHHVMHTLGSRLWGFTQDLYESGSPSPPPTPEQVARLASAFPDLAAVAGASGHDPASVVGTGCDDQYEFEFALDLLLDGFERLLAQGWPAST